MLYGVHFAWGGFELTTLVVIGNDYMGNCKCNYHTTTTAPRLYKWYLIKITQHRDSLFALGQDIRIEGFITHGDPIAENRRYGI